jgi:hypothetical protein
MIGFELCSVSIANSFDDASVATALHPSANYAASPAANHSSPDEHIVVDKGLAPRRRLHRRNCAKFTQRQPNKSAVERESSGVADG